MVYTHKIDFIKLQKNQVNNENIYINNDNIYIQIEFIRNK